MIPSTTRIFVCLEPQDMRRGFDGLALAAKEQLGEDYLDIVDWCVCLLHAAVVRARGVGRRHAWEHVGAADLKACSGPHACAHSRARTHICCAPWPPAGRFRRTG